jgi:hypothetical protein
MALAAQGEEEDQEEVPQESEDHHLDPTGEVDFIFKRGGISVFADVTIATHGVDFASASVASMSRLSFDSICEKKEQVKARKYQQGLSEWSALHQTPAVLETFVLNTFGRSNQKLDRLLEACAESMASRFADRSISSGKFLHDYRKDLALKVSKAHARSYAHQLSHLRAVNLGVRNLFVEEAQLLERILTPPVLI